MTSTLIELGGRRKIVFLFGSSRRRTTFLHSPTAICHVQLFLTLDAFQALILSSSFLFFYGLLSSIAPTFGWIVFLRFLVGVMIGCVPQSVTLFSEFLPTRQRGKCVVLLDCFWAFGACAEVLLASLVMPRAGWRWLLAFSALPSLVFAIGASYWLPESARFNAARGQSDEALETLERVAAENKKHMLLGRLVVDVDLADAGYFSRGRFRDLLSRELRRTTLSLWFMWSACSFVYYGVVLMTTELFESPGDDVCKLDGSLKQERQMFLQLTYFSCMAILKQGP
jgi:hypothetical protein